ncbi:hypothetical protein FACS1894166_11290 [Bacilli bacterium]|nr:hypothetical protein FACS1894166_11290 [Bacilli bacterium]
MEYAIRRTNHFRVINHLIWKYNFGVYTSQKYVSSHYHILYCCKNDGKPYFNKYAYHNEQHSIGSGSAIYNDLQDVIVINREYKPNTIKNCNQLPSKLVEKLIKHSSKKGDVVLDIFSGGFTTEFAALKLHRKA